ncbi:hypothetical protein Tco_0928314 [Tanacetum coccineum]
MCLTSEHLLASNNPSLHVRSSVIVTVLNQWLMLNMHPQWHHLFVCERSWQHTLGAIGKSNCYLNEEKSQPNPIYKIAVDILKQTNFFRAFTASSTIPAIYIQQFWDTICFDSKAGSYKCQLDEQWFDLTKDTLRDALQITPVDNNRAFSPPPTPDTLVGFVNKLGYPKEVIHLSNVTTNDMFQPWRALTTIINLCLTGKTSGFERPRAPVLQILWGVVNRAHIDYAERMWEEFTQSIHTFTEDKRNLAQHTLGKKKATLILIPSIRFTKLIIFHLQRLHNFHPRPESPLHLPTEEPVLGNLKFSAKGTKREVFGMTIPNELINDVIRGSDYYDAYLEKEKVAKHQTISHGLDRHEEEICKRFWREPNGCLPTQRGPLRPVVFRETDTRNSTILRCQRRSHVPTETSGREDSTSLYAELGLSGSDTNSDEATPPVIRSRTQDEGQAGSDPGKLDEGQAGPNPDDVAESQPLPNSSSSRWTNLEHSDVEIMSLQQRLQLWRSKFFIVKPSMPENEKKAETLKLNRGLHRRDDMLRTVMLIRIKRKLRRKKKDSPKTLPGYTFTTTSFSTRQAGGIRASGTTGASDSAQAPPPPPPSSSTHQGDQSTSTVASSSSKTAASAEYSAWTMTDTRIKPSITTIPDDLYMDDDPLR